ncbi:MAG: hypothetical protein HY511_04950 [Actinobacteria bacterium]|nr:hypothetical protein [Actinomycetota bacterium]
MAEKRASTRPVGGRTRAPKEKPPGREPAGAAREQVCPVAFCPVGMALTAVQQAGPDVVDHLLSAAREFLLAAKAVIDARAEGFERPGSVPLEKIEIG